MRAYPARVRVDSTYPVRVDERARRIGENEALYRSINERIEDLNQAFGLVAETMTVVCECGELSCTQQIELDLPTYERVRSDPTWFVVVPGHEIADVESIVEKHESYNVICKDKGEAAELATELDPRSSRGSHTSMNVIV